MKLNMRINSDTTNNIMWSTYTKNLIIISSIIVVIVFIPLLITRHYQSLKLRKIINQYDTIKTESIKLETVPLPNGNLLFKTDKYFKPVDKGEILVEEYMAVFNGVKCNYPTLWATLKYDGATINGEANDRMDFSRSISLDLTSNGIKRYFFPAISQNYAPWKIDYFASHFSGIIISEKQSQCLEGLFRVTDLRQLSMLLTLELPFDNDLSYARLFGWEHETNYTVPDKMGKNQIIKRLSKDMKPISATDYEYKDPIVTVIYSGINNTTSFWRVNGYAKESGRGEGVNEKTQNSFLAEISYKNKDALRADGDLLITKQKWHLKESAFVASGELYNGGVAFVLLNENRPSGLVIVTKSGKFNVIIEVPRDGLYSVGLMNYVKTYNAPENRLIAKTGWVE
jgi:hypothetical protein